MKRVLILVGLPASGKSTFAKNLLDTEKGRWVRVNKDLLREMAHNSNWSSSNEKFVLMLRDQIIIAALDEGKNVIVDDTNFEAKHITHITALVKGKAGVEVDDSFLNTSLEDCIKRDLKRPNSVGKDVIIGMYQKYITKPASPPPYDPTLPKAIIVDMDGTLALLNGRHPFNAFTCDLDLPNIPVLETVHRSQVEVEVLIVSGRTDDCLPQTKKWLEKYGVTYKVIHMRKTGDQRKDSIIKEEIYQQYINGKYNIQLVLDDRQQVVEMWRSLGLTVFQVDVGNF